jgi:hypothetical protein
MRVPGGQFRTALWEFHNGIVYKYCGFGYTCLGGIRLS